MKKSQSKVGRGRGCRSYSFYSDDAAAALLYGLGSEDLNETRMERRGDVGAAATSCLGDAWLRNATWRNISCVEGSTGRRIKDLAKTVDEEDYQLQSSAGHCMYQSSADVEDGGADTWTRNVSRENLHCCSRV